jgi:hypothetical protein
MKNFLLLVIAMALMGFSHIESVDQSMDTILGNGGTTCRSVTTDCGGGNSSNNRACVSYDSAEDYLGAAYAAQAISSQMGEAACSRAGEINQATVIIKDR